MRRASVWARFASGLLLSALAILAVACSGILNTGTPIGPRPGPGPAPGSGLLALFGRDAPLDELVEFEITVTDVVLDPGSVSVLPQPVRLELTSLQLTTDMIHLAQNVSTGSFTSITLMLANPEIRFRDSSGTIVDIQPALQTSAVTAGINFTVASNQVTALLLDFDLRAMVVTDISGNITDVDPSGNISITVLDVAGQSDEFEDEVGRVVSVDATSSSFIFEPFASCEQITVTTDVATQFASFDRGGLTNTFTSLQAGQIVEVDADLQVDGTFLAEKVEFEDDVMEDETEGLITDVTRATGPSQDSFGLVLFEVAPCTASLPAVELATVNVSTTVGVVSFRIDDDGFPVDPTLFDGAEDLAAGQKVEVDPVEALGTAVLTAEKIKLEDLTILGRVAAPISTLAFDLVPTATLFADPSITVQLSLADTEFENLPNTVNDLFVGRLVRVRGLLVRDAAGEMFLVAKRVDGAP